VQLSAGYAGKWKPNSSDFAYVTKTISGSQSLFIRKTVSGSDLIVLTSGGCVSRVSNSQLAWSTDGTEIAFTAHAAKNQSCTGSSDIFKVDLDGNNLLLLTPGSSGLPMSASNNPDNCQNETSPVLSDDGSKFAYYISGIGGCGGASGHKTVDINGGNIQGTSYYDQWAKVISPNGAKEVYSSNGDLWIKDINSGSAQKIIDGNIFSSLGKSCKCTIEYPDWSDIEISSVISYTDQ